MGVAEGPSIGKGPHPPLRERGGQPGLSSGYFFSEERFGAAFSSFLEELA